MQKQIKHYKIHH